MIPRPDVDREGPLWGKGGYCRWRRRRSALGRALPLDLGAVTGRLRRILVVAERPGEGPFAMRFADLRHGGLRGAGSALASRLRAGWMQARVTKVARVSARFSKSLASVGCDSQLRGRWMNCCPGASSPHHPGSFMAFLRGQNRRQNPFTDRLEWRNPWRLLIVRKSRELDSNFSFRAR